MSLGSYGIVRPADVSPSDIDIFYTYSPSRDFGNQTALNKLAASASDILIPQYHNTNSNPQPLQTADGPQLCIRHF